MCCDLGLVQITCVPWKYSLITLLYYLDNPCLSLLPIHPYKANMVHCYLCFTQCYKEKLIHFMTQSLRYLDSVCFSQIYAIMLLASLLLVWLLMF